MSALWTSEEIEAAVGGTAHGAFEASGVAFDSREVEPGHLFVAMKGEATDGHLFLDKAFAAGAAGAIVEAGPGDIVLLAGKGHEQGQIVGDRVLPFDDVAVAREETA